jgi:hypothetical protein
MMRKAVIALLAGMSTLLLVFGVYAADANSTGVAVFSSEWLKEWFPFIGSGIGGIALTLITIIPSIRKVGSLFTDAALELNKLLSKYKELLSGDVKADLFKVLMKFDTAFEMLALIMGKVGAKKLQTFLQNIIKSEWYTQSGAIR